MRINRYAVTAIVGAGALLIGGGVAVAGPGDGDRSARCGERLAKIAEARGVSVEQLQADIKARLLARVDAAENAGRISSERAAQLRERISVGSLCQGARHGKARLAARSMLRAAAEFLGLDRAELREQLPGNSLAGLAQKQGKSVDALKAAMLAPAKERLAKAVAAGRITQAQADAALEKLGLLADRLASNTFEKR
ncbi:MAG TPA: hypothetical protein VI409_02285 [Gaiellaceae bacterium]|nr:hypothetical protein [Gaiellaceae bacterium]